MAVCKANPEGAMGDDFRERQVWSVDIEVSADDLEIGCEGAQEGVR